MNNFVHKKIISDAVHGLVDGMVFHAVAGTEAYTDTNVDDGFLNCGWNDDMTLFGRLPDVLEFLKEEFDE